MVNLKFSMDQLPFKMPSTKGYGKVKLYVKEGNDMIYVARATGFGEII